MDGLLSKWKANGNCLIKNYYAERISKVWKPLHFMTSYLAY